MEQIKRYAVDFPITESFSITGNEYHHLVNVMRARTGDPLIVCNGDGMDYRCEIADIGPKAAQIRLLSVSRNEQEPDVDVTVFLGLLKGDHTELEIQKLSELGVRCVVPFVSENTVSRADEKKIERFRRIAAESAKQCRRASVLQVEPVLRFSEVLKRAGEFDCALFCFEGEQTQTLGAALPTGAKKVALVIGSEGGFQPEEAEQAKEQGFVSVSLGRRILRAETAAIAGTAVLMYLLGEWGRS